MIHLVPKQPRLTVTLIPAQQPDPARALAFLRTLVERAREHALKQAAEKENAA